MMNLEIHEKLDNLFSEIYRLQKDQIDGRSLTPKTIMNYQERLVKIIVDECSVALCPSLRDMISRGKAIDMIKQHFGVKIK